jgi:hypothetical protein
MPDRVRKVGDQLDVLGERLEAVMADLRKVTNILGKLLIFNNYC